MAFEKFLRARWDTDIHRSVWHNKWCDIQVVAKFGNRPIVRVSQREEILDEWVARRKESFSRFSRIELLSTSWYKRLSYDSEQTARNKATLATLIRLGDAKSDTRARITMLSEYIRSITRT